MKYENQIISSSKGGIQYAENALQWNIVEGLDTNLINPVKIINSLYIGSFPRRYKKLFANTYEFSHTISSKDINVGFLNLIGIKHESRYLTLKPYLKSWANPMRFGQNFIWVDSSTRLRIKATKPASDTDGIIVGLQA